MKEINPEEKQSKESKSIIREKKALISTKGSDAVNLGLISYILAFFGKIAESDIVSWIALVVSIGALALFFYNCPKVMKIASDDRKLKKKAITRLAISFLLCIGFFCIALQSVGFIK